MANFYFAVEIKEMRYCRNNIVTSIVPRAVSEERVVTIIFEQKKSVQELYQWLIYRGIVVSETTHIDRTNIKWRFKRIYRKLKDKYKRRE